MTATPLAKLYPGAAAVPLNLSLTNGNSHGISLTSLIVGLRAITLAPHPLAPGRCSSSDFRIQQFRGSLPIKVSPGQTVTLAGLGIPTFEMPQIRMVNQPYNQDGCEGARLSLSYGGSAAG